MTPEQISLQVFDRLKVLLREDKTSDQVFAELAAVNATFAADGEAEMSPAGAAKGFDLCVKGAECFLRLAVTFAMAEDELFRRGEGTDV